MLDFDWLFRDQNGFKLLRVLDTTENDEIFDKEQLQIVVDLYW